MALFQGNIFSRTLGFDTQIYVSLPQDGRRYHEYGPQATLILLHGVSGNASGWIRSGLADEMADKYNIAVIVPEGHKSFWLDMKYGGHYTEYLTGELPYLAGEMFNIPIDSEHLMIAGLSMGGYGALHAALSDPESFSAVGAFSPVTDIREFFEMSDILANTSDCGLNFTNELLAVTGVEKCIDAKDDLFVLSEKILTAKHIPKIYIACGNADPIVFAQNQSFYEHTQRIGLDLTYDTWPGSHDWIFWREAVDRFLDNTISKVPVDTNIGPIPPFSKRN